MLAIAKVYEILENIIREHMSPKINISAIDTVYRSALMTPYMGSDDTFV